VKPLPLLIVALALLLCVPLLVVAGFVVVPSGEVWRHLAETVLDRYLGNSLWLLVWVALGTLAIGVSGAWLTALCEFPGRRVFEWALLLPLALPAYIVAYTYTGLLDGGGPIQSWIREVTGLRAGQYPFPQIRSLGGAAAMLALVLYPYVYLLTRATFLAQSTAVLEVSRSLGQDPWSSFFRLALPLARPAIVAGLSLAMMETLADYGVVQHFGVATFTTGIFRTWFGLGDVAAAAQLAALLLAVVFLLLALERWSRRRARYHHTDNRQGRHARFPLTGWRAAGAVALCAFPIVFGFLVPLAQLGAWAWPRAADFLDPAFQTLLWNSLTLAFAAALLCLAVALLLAYGRRLHPTPLTQGAVQLAGSGYAIPGAVVAVGVMIPFAWLDNQLDAWLRASLGISSGLLFSGTLFALLFGYLVRFLAVALGAVESGLTQLRPSLEQAARSLGETPLGVLRRLHLPLLRGSLFSALLLVFVEALKELPATLILRPFNFNTLAVRTYELAGDERLADSALPALAIVLAGLLPTLLLSRSIGRGD